MTTSDTISRFEVSTDGIPEAERFDFWRDACCAPLGLTPKRTDTTAPFDAHVSHLVVGPLHHVHYKQITACRVGRTLRDIARHPRDSCTIYRESGAGAWFRRGGQDYTTTRGDIVIADLDLPFETQSLAPTFAHDVWLIPKQALAPYLPAYRRQLLYKLPATDAVGQLLVACLDSLVREAAHMTPDTVDRVVNTLCRLIGTAVGAVSDAPPEAMHDARLAQAKQHIERNLADPHLTPGSIAAALGISLRSLHAAFEPTGTGVARLILQRRLEECRATLLSDRRRSVTDIAFAWGFNTLSAFYRAFQAAFGASPGELRAAARHPPPH